MSVQTEARSHAVLLRSKQWTTSEHSTCMSRSIGLLCKGRRATYSTLVYSDKQLSLRVLVIVIVAHATISLNYLNVVALNNGIE